VSSDALLRAEGLSASYDGRLVFRGASLSLGPGLYTLQGANGRGKSTFLRLLAGAQLPDSGEAWIAGMSLRDAPRAARRRLGYAPDESHIYPFMTGRDLFRFVANAKGVAPPADPDDFSADLGLGPFLAVRFDAMSLGTQKKVLLRAAFIGSPRVVLLDEPSNGIDAAARRALFEKLCDYAADATILCATHDATMIEETGATALAMSQICLGPSAR